MFKTLKGQTKSWSTKIIIILLALSFAVWGISDVFRTGSSDVVATVGETEIPAAVLGREYSNEMRRIQARYPDFSGEEARELGLPAQILGRLVEQALVVEEAGSKGMVIPDVKLATQIIQDNPGLLENGEFNTVLYERALNRTGKSLEAFESGVRDEMLRKLVIGSIAASGRVPIIMSDLMEKYTQGRRDAVIIKINNNKNSEEISDASIADYYEKNAESYKSPEYREIVLLQLTKDSVRDEIDLSDEDLFEEYEYRASEFEVPERRNVTQIISNDEIMIKKLAELIKEGKSFAEITKIATQQGAMVTEFPNLMNGSLPKAAEVAVLDTPVGGVSVPVKTPFGWHLFSVNEFKPEGLVPFKEIKEDLRSEVFAELATDTLYGLSATIEDTLAGGGSLEDAANSVALSILELGPISRYGKYKIDNPISVKINPSEDILRTAFSTALGETSDLIEVGEDGYFLLRVVSIEESEVRPFADVRDKVIEDIKDNLKAEINLVLAEELKQKIKSGVSITEAVRGSDYKIELIKGLSRSEPNADYGITTEVIEKLFSVKANSKEPIISFVNSHQAVLVPTKEYQAHLDDPESLRRASVLSIGKSREIDVEILYRFGLQTQHNIEVNGSTFEKLFSSP
ncbi:MAG: hypothetical protein CMD67_06580 [Gammaproteobacteria bacterium]|nr:hypothetical protein [Gammaproteobacteria bacterium]